jgi:hypothetical protein
MLAAGEPTVGRAATRISGTAGTMFAQTVTRRMVP